MNSYESLAKILRVQPDTLKNLEIQMAALTGKKGVVNEIHGQNIERVANMIRELGLPTRDYSSEEIYNALVHHLKSLDDQLYFLLDKPELPRLSAACGKMCQIAVTLAKPEKGFFIKKEKAVSMLEKFPPDNLLRHFGYSNVRELIDKQGFASVFSALRFAQDNEWMNKFFDETYDDLTPDDFESREAEIKILEPQWLDVAEKFLAKKYHNVSHLKEFGIIFIIPLAIDTPGETVRLFTLLLHYLNEVPFYSKLFRIYAEKPKFSASVKSLLRGDVPEGPTPQWESHHPVWRIVQRYLAKDDENDFRLFEQHVNPEAEHWYRAAGNFSGLREHMGLEKYTFGNWQELDFVGDFFPNKNGEPTLVSFDLIDLAMSLVKKGQVKYLYHQQEALWNKIFIEFLGRESMSKLIDENIIDGFIKL